MAISRVSSTSLTDCRIDYRAVHGDLDFHRWRDLRAQHRQFRQHPIHDGDGVGVGLLVDRQNDRARTVEPGRDLVVLDAVIDSRDLVEPDRRTVAPGDDHVTVIGGLVHLAGRLESHILFRSVQACRPASTNLRARRRRGRLRAICRAPPRLPDRPAPGSQISDCRKSRPARRPGSATAPAPMVMSPYSLTADSGSVSEPSEMNRTAKSDGLTFRKLGGIVISIGNRRCAMVSAVCTSSAAASMLRLRSNWMTIDGRALRRGRGHRRDAGDRRELALDRPGDGSRHGIGARARQGRRHGDGGKIDLGKRGDRQQAEAEHAERDDRSRHAASS